MKENSCQPGISPGLTVCHAQSLVFEVWRQTATCQVKTSIVLLYGARVTVMAHPKGTRRFFARLCLLLLTPPFSSERLFTTRQHEPSPYRGVWPAPPQINNSECSIEVLLRLLTPTFPLHLLWMSYLHIAASKGVRLSYTNDNGKRKEYHNISLLCMDDQIRRHISKVTRARVRLTTLASHPLSPPTKKTKTSDTSTPDYSL